MSNPKSNTCVQCGGELKLSRFDNKILLHGNTFLPYDIALPYCPNPDCPNYGLVQVGIGGVDNG